MCGRVYIAPANPELRELVKEMNRSGLADLFRKERNEQIRAEGEILPTSVVPVVALNRRFEQCVFPMKWGFRMPNGLLINARAETASEKPAFSESWRKHRCVIPASWYFEWEHSEKNKTGFKYALKPDTSDIIWLAGLYRIENGIPAFVILTREAADDLSWMHDRMPVMLPEQAIPQWINPEGRPEELIRNCLTKVVWQRAV